MPYLKQWLVLGGVLVLGYLALLALVYVQQRSMLYFPTHLGPATRLSPWKVDGQVIGYGHEVPNPSRVWLMLHGNGGEAGHRDYILQCIGRTEAAFVLEYPGYGLRAGVPSQQSIDAAAAEAYRALRAQFPGRPIGVIGESIGSGPACTLAREAVPPDLLVLVTPFDSLASRAADIMWFLPVRLLMKDRWDNVAALRGYRNPVHVYGAMNDTIIPVKHAKALAEATGATFTAMPSGHNDWMTTGLVQLGKL